MKHLCIILLASTALFAEQGVLTFDKISKYDRAAEPVAFGIPFPAGGLREAAQL